MHNTIISMIVLPLVLVAGSAHAAHGKRLAAIDAKTASLAEALQDWISLLEKDDLRTATDRWAKDSQAGATMKQQWANLRECHKKFDYRGWIDGKGEGGGAKQIGDSKSFKVGGHNFGHTHIDWEKTDAGWRIAKVWICR